jgi:bifunctional NMN adenylyltransferase/nudix hydrolase
MLFNHRSYGIVNKKYNLAVIVGRFQPVHNGHVALMRRAAEIAENVVVVVGSANRPRSYKNPWLESERRIMVQEASIPITRETGVKFVIEANHDTIYSNEAWVSRVQQIVARNSDPSDKVALVGHVKDSSSFYLRMFPQWDFVEQELVEPLDATKIRDLYFTPNVNLNFLSGVVPAFTLRYLDMFAQKPAYQEIMDEKDHLIRYRKQFENLPYPPIFVTADAVVVQSGHVLMVQRGAQPGRGQWALPGGFVNAYTDASVFDAAIRELKEETGIRVPERVLRGSRQNSQVFDAVDRSQRGRTITHAFHFALDEADGRLPRVRGSDDAVKARWIPLGELNPSEIFEDHADIIAYFVGE